ncbi:MAG: DNA primase [Kiritimatiellae bacterium]|nr:DNA primase [Kiritimatiellia bacterium]
MAKGITEAAVEEIKARIDLADLIASYGIQIKTAGASKKACCPFHHEKTPSFNINESKGFYHCFGCGESGDVIKFVQKMDGLTFVEAVKKLAEQCGVKIEEKEDPAGGKRKRLLALMAELAQFYHRCLLKTKEAESAREYLKGRDLGSDVQESFLIGYAPNGISTIMKWAEKYNFTAEELSDAGVIKPPRGPGDRGYHRFGGRLMFSIRDKRGRVVAFSGRQLVASKNSGKYVNSPETPIFKKSNVLFGFDKAAGNIAKSAHREAIVCEGQIDTIRLHISGFPVAVASQGTAFTEEHVKMLKKVADQVALVFDDDAAGRKAAIRTAGLFLAAEMPVRVVSLPEGDDPDSYLRKHPAEDFQKLLDDAESIMSFQVRAEKAKETNPDSIDAMARVTKAILGTIAQSKNAVIRAGMVGEAAKLLGVPSAALSEELGKIKVEARKPVKSTVDAEDAFEDDFSSDRPTDWPADQVEEAVEGEDAHRAMPPPPRELALCAFLMANEYDRTLDGMLGEYLPPKVFAHDFTRRFIETWRAEVVKNEDLLRDFAGKLEGHEREWFDSVLLGGGKTESSGLSATDILQDFVRSLWADELKRERGSLPASGDAEADLRRMKLSMDLKRLSSVRWAAVKDMVRDWLR